jgi:hypothetical protein
MFASLKHFLYKPSKALYQEMATLQPFNADFILVFAQPFTLKFQRQQTQPMNCTLY